MQLREGNSAEAETARFSLCLLLSGRIKGKTVCGMGPVYESFKVTVHRHPFSKPEALIKIGQLTVGGYVFGPYVS